MEKPILCSDCFKDYGLKKMAERIGTRGNYLCPNCGSETGAVLDIVPLLLTFLRTNMWQR